MSTTSKRKVVVIYTLIVMIVGLVVAGVNMLDRAKAKAEQIRASGRLSQMRLALEMYEAVHGTLPPLFLRNSEGIPSHSWRALILPYLGSRLPKQLELSQPWNSDHNRRITDSIPQDEWVWFALDRSQITQPVSTHILAYVGRESIWDADTGMPKGRIAEYPNAISLAWVPKSNLHPLQPGDITEADVRKLIESGQEVLFIRAQGSSGWGVISIEEGDLAFHTWQEELDRREGRR